MNWMPVKGNNPYSSVWVKPQHKSRLQLCFCITIPFSFLKIHNWWRDKTTMSGTSSSSNAGCVKILVVRIGLVDGFVFVAGWSLSSLSLDNCRHMCIYGFHLGISSGNHQMFRIPACFRHETRSVCDRNVIVLYPHLHVLCRKISVHYKCTHVYPPIKNHVLRRAIIICMHDSLLRHIFPILWQIDSGLWAWWTEGCKIACTWCCIYIMAISMPFVIFQVSPLSWNTEKFFISVLQCRNELQGKDHGTGY